MHLAIVPQSQFVSHRQPNFSRFEFRKIEPRDPLLIESNVPSDGERFLSLRFLESFVVVGFDLDEGPKNVLVLIGVLVPNSSGQRFSMLYPSPQLENPEIMLTEGE